MSVYKKLLDIQTELKAPKNQKNTFGNYNYRSAEDVLEALKPLLLSNNVTVIINDEIVNVGNRFYIKAKVKFIDFETGESIETTAFAREPENKKGYDESQITGSASSYARKYALNGLFMIDDVKDADGQEPEKEKEEDTRPWLTEKLFNQAVTRMEAGEKDVYKKTDETFRMKKEYRAKLKSIK